MPIGLTTWLSQRARHFAALAALALLSGATVDAAEDGVTTHYGYAVFGELKYGPDFDHFDYVDPDAPKGGIFRYAQTSTFDSLNIISLLTTPPPILTFMSDTLMEQSRDEPASFYCHVCRTISWPEDFAWVEFELRPEARFGDGHAMGVEDVLFTFEVSKGISTPLFHRVSQIVERVEQTGPHSVRLYFKVPNLPTNPAVVVQMPIMPKHFYGKLDLDKPLLEAPPANGPYEVARFDQGRFIELRRVENYWARDLPVSKGRYNFDVIRHDYYRDASLLNEAFAAGQIDLRLETNTANLRQQSRLPAFRSGDIVRTEIAYENGAVYNSVTINSRRPFLSNPRVREALVLGYDYEFLKSTILGGNFGRLTSNFANSPFEATGLPGPAELEILDPFRDDLPAEVFTTPPQVPVGGSWDNRRQNLLKARELLLEEGYRVANGRLRDPSTGEPVVLRLVTSVPQNFGLAAPFIDSMRRLGIEVRFRSMDVAQLRLAAGNGDFDLMIFPAVFVPSTAPGVGMTLIWGSGSASAENTMNYTGVDDPVIDAALQSLVTAPDRETVVASMRVLDRVERWLHYSIPLNHSYPTPVGRLPITYWNKFGMPAKSEAYNFPYYSLESWWYDPAKAATIRHGAQAS
jgi:microcin C transport system substrate-binding protein